MGESFAFACWARLTYPTLVRMGTKSFWTCAHGQWRSERCRAATPA